MLTKTCSDCKIDKPIDSFEGDIKRPRWRRACCKKCRGSRRSKKHLEKRFGDEYPLYWARLSCHNAKDRCRRSGILFAISIQDVQSAVVNANGACAYCRAALNFRGTVSDRDRSPSLDRIIPSIGYTPINIAICCYKCNRTKNDANPDELRRLSAAVDSLVRERGLGASK